MSETAQDHSAAENAEDIMAQVRLLAMVHRAAGVLICVVPIIVFMNHYIRFLSWSGSWDAAVSWTGRLAFLACVTLSALWAAVGMWVMFGFVWFFAGYFGRLLEARIGQGEAQAHS